MHFTAGLRSEGIRLILSYNTNVEKQTCKSQILRRHEVPLVHMTVNHRNSKNILFILSHIQNTRQGGEHDKRGISGLNIHNTFYLNTNANFTGWHHPHTPCPRLDSQHSHDSSRSSRIPMSRDSLPSSDLCRHQQCMRCTDIGIGKTFYSTK